MWDIGKLSASIFLLTCLKYTHQRTSPSFLFTGTSGELYSGIDSVISPFWSHSHIWLSRDPSILGFRGRGFCLIADPGARFSFDADKSVVPTCPSGSGVNTLAYLCIMQSSWPFTWGWSCKYPFLLIPSSSTSSVCLEADGSWPWVSWLMLPAASWCPGGRG